MLIAFHGSWNRSVPTGYKIVLLDTSTQNSREQDFITGWLPNDGRDWGRPVDVKFSPSGKLFITDDETGAIYLFTMK
jgi:glucose/arabinose dehydrogenase